MTKMIKKPYTSEILHGAGREHILPQADTLHRKCITPNVQKTFASGIFVSLHSDNRLTTYSFVFRFNMCILFTVAYCCYINQHPICRTHTHDLKLKAKL